MAHERSPSEAVIPSERNSPLVIPSERSSPFVIPSERSESRIRTVPNGGTRIEPDRTEEAGSAPCPRRDCCSASSANFGVVDGEDLCAGLSLSIRRAVRSGRFRKIAVQDPGPSFIKQTDPIARRGADFSTEFTLSERSESKRSK